jgi:hypothetical protein
MSVSCGSVVLEVTKDEDPGVGYSGDLRDAARFTTLLSADNTTYSHSLHNCSLSGVHSGTFHMQQDFSLNTPNSSSAAT